MDKIKEYKNGWTVTQNAPSFPGGMVAVTVRDSAGNVYDKIRCDTKSQARDYFRAFCKIAKTQY